MRGVNKVILVGNATRDTELRTTTSGKSVANLRMATSRTTRNAADELETRPQYHTVICFDRLAETTHKHVGKGRLIYVEGRLETRTFTDKAGHERELTEVVANDIQFLDHLPRAVDDGDLSFEPQVSPDDIPS